MRDLRGTAAGPPVPPPVLRFPAGHRVVISGLPGSGKSTLMRRTTAKEGVLTLLDSQEVRDGFARRLPRWLPYAAYRPAVRFAHYARLRRALRSTAGVLLHDSGRTGVVRRWLARDARRRGLGYHLVLLDVPAATALAGQTERGRGVSRYAFGRHQRALVLLLGEVAAGRLPAGCASVTLLDRDAAEALGEIVFGGEPPD
ncbi:AAA family ATPase [Streptomyces sp. B6B3]|uniref:AAA family ATPase n=1 Tax=Streptomyces sp. B6B3 TaxID=3153570 RepID=UPI00325DE99F